MVTSLESRSNQDVTSKSNTTFLLVESIDYERNSNEHPQNKNNQNELHQWNRKISVPSLKLKQHSEQKVLENHSVSRQKSSNLFLSKISSKLRKCILFIKQSHVKYKSWDPEMYSGITINFKTPKSFNFPETEQSFRFFGLKNTHGFDIPN